MPGRPQEEECKTVTVTKRRDLIWVKKCSKRAFLKAQVSFSSWKIIYLLVIVYQCSEETLNPVTSVSCRSTFATMSVKRC